MPYKRERFNLKHFTYFEPRKEQECDFFYVKNDRTHLEYFRLRGVTLLHNAKTIAVLSFVDAGFGTYIPLLLVSKHAIKHKVALVKFIYEYFEKYIDSGVRRIEALIDAEDPTALRFVKLFGFDIIGIKHCSSIKGGDQIIVERLVRKPW